MEFVNYQALAGQVLAIPNWRFLSAAEIGRHVGQPERSMQRYIFQMRQRGLLPARSIMQLGTYRNYQRIQRYLANHPGQVNLIQMAEAITGKLCAGSNLNSFRTAIEQAKSEGLPLDYERIDDGPRPLLARAVQRGPSLTEGKPRFISWDQVDPDHLQRFIELARFVGGRHAA